MENFGKRRCKLCFNLVNDEHFEEINDGTRDILNILLLTRSLDDRSEQIICSPCSLKLTQAFIFKSMCLCTDNILIPYVDNETGSSVDLREVYIKETEKKQLINTLDGHKVCRLCMQLIKDEFLPICEMEDNMIQKYIPEINFSVVKEPVICKQCFDSFNTHSSFIRSCLEIEENFNSSHNTEIPRIPSLDSCIKTEEIVIKSEGRQYEEELVNIYSTVPKLEEEETTNKTEYMMIKQENEDSKSDVPFFNTGDDCINEHEPEGIETTKNNIHERKEQDVSVSNKYEHNISNCNAKYNSHPVSLQQKRSQEIHKDTSEVQLYKCDICDFKCKRKGNLRCRQLKHKDSSEVKMHECGTCAFRTKHKNSLLKHQLSHKDPAEVQLYECDICGFKTKHKSNLVNHQQVHRDPIYKCNLCDYRTRHKSYLSTHEQGHNNFPRAQIYKCHVCCYETKSKKCLVLHKCEHKHPMKWKLEVIEKINKSILFS